MKKKPIVAAVIFTVTMLCVALFSYSPCVAQASTLTGSQIKQDSTGTITVSDVDEAGVSVKVYKMYNVNWVNAAGSPQDPTNIWESNLVDSVKSVNSAYIGDKDAVTEDFKNADANFFGALAGKITSNGVTPIKTLTASGSVPDLAMGGYLLVISNSAKYSYAPIVVNLVPSYQEGTGWVFNQNPAAVNPDNAQDCKRSDLTPGNVKPPEGSEGQPTGQPEMKLIKNQGSIGDVLTFCFVAPVPQFKDGALHKDFALSDTLGPGLELIENSIETCGYDPVQDKWDGGTYMISSVGEKPFDDCPTTPTFYVSSYSKLANDFPRSYTKIFVRFKAKITKTLEPSKDGENYAVTNPALHVSADPYGLSEAHVTNVGNKGSQTYTYGITLKANDEDNTSKLLPNAEYKVSKQIVDEDDWENPGTMITKTLGFSAAGTGNDYQYDPEADASTVKTDANGVLRLSGLGQDTYTLTLKNPPLGYGNPSRDVIYVIKDAEYDMNFDGIVGQPDGGTSSENHPYIGYALQTQSFKANDALVISNLPHTGEMGTVLMSVFGVVIVGFVAIKTARRIVAGHRD